jgi:integrase
VRSRIPRAGARRAGDRLPLRELTRLEVCDFNPDASTLAIRQSKSGKPRHVVLTDEGAAFFRRYCAGRSGMN